MLVRGEKLTFKSIIKYLKKRKDVLDVEDLSEDEQSLYLRVLTKKPIGPSNLEIENNQRARSAKLRAAEKL